VAGAGEIRDPRPPVVSMACVGETIDTSEFVE
jgi:hypothetical protein